MNYKKLTETDKEIETLKQELRATKNTLRKLITWLEMELGSQSATTLLDELSIKAQHKQP